MIRTHPVRRMSIEEGGEYVLGLKDLGTHACYLIYGELKPGEEGRRICPGRGHEEILMAVKGDLEISGPLGELVLEEGQAAHFREEEACLLANRGDSHAVYVLAGGHSGSPH